MSKKSDGLGTRKGWGMIRRVTLIGALVAVSASVVLPLSTSGVAGAAPPPATGKAICKIASGKRKALARDSQPPAALAA